eukprot:COSAG01_NODE_43726_length_426_cov_16.122324_1_plen_34_part_10
MRAPIGTSSVEACVDAGALSWLILVNQQRTRPIF